MIAAAAGQAPDNSSERSRVGCRIADAGQGRLRADSGGTCGFVRSRPTPKVQSIELTSLKLPFNSDADFFTGYFAQ
jgi:hypothetical protein